MKPPSPRRRLLVAGSAATALLAMAGCASRPAPSTVAALAPTGRLRASINLGNPVLARRDPATGQAAGVSVDLARSLAEQLGVPVELIVFDAAAKSVEAVTGGSADIGFFAIDPLRAEGIRFSPAYYPDRRRVSGPQRLAAEPERRRRPAETRVMVGQGSAYDLFLTRELKAAQLLRAPTSPVVVDEFLKQRADVAAGVRQQLQADAARLGGLRLLPGRFMVIEQAMGVPAARGDDAARALAAFVEQAKASGFVAASLQRHGIQGALVAPAARA
jgi:polar amino acid transport system substrate-binding protein